MKKLLIIGLLGLCTLSCMKDRSVEATVTAYNGNDGLNGKDGENGTTILKPGLLCNVYDSLSVNRNNGLITILANSTPKFSKVVELFDVGDSRSVNGFPKFTPVEQALVGTEDYALDCHGYLDVPVSGNYKFKVLSDDNSRLVVNFNTIINMDQLQAPSTSTSSNTLLYAGLNRINVLYFQGPHTQIALKIEWQTPLSASMSTMQLIPAKNLLNLTNKGE